MSWLFSQALVAAYLQANEQGHSGRLNPQWVEWLMDCPIGWTDLPPLATDRFQEWQQQHSSGWLPD